MLYAMKQKVFCWGDDYRILDQNGRDVYLVDGKAFVLLRKRLMFLDMAGSELAEIRQRLLTWGPSYDIVRSGQVVATVSKHVFTLALCKFTVDVPGPDDLEATGSLFDYEYTFRRHGRQVAFFRLIVAALGKLTDSLFIPSGELRLVFFLVISFSSVAVCCASSRHKSRTRRTSCR